jgi:flagellin-like hook-associated protein FlgL
MDQTLNTAAKEILTTDKKELTATELQKIKDDIERTATLSVTEGVNPLNDNTGDKIVNTLQTAFDTFKEKTGRKGMTYSELRDMMG